MSMTFDARKNDEKINSFVSVFTKAETSPFLLPDGKSFADLIDPEEFEDNPAHCPEYHFNTSGSNGLAILRDLGYVDLDMDYAPFVEIEKFCSQCRAYLSNEEGGLDSYIVDKVQCLLVLATEGKARGATHITIDG